MGPKKKFERISDYYKFPMRFNTTSFIKEEGGNNSESEKDSKRSSETNSEISSKENSRNNSRKNSLKNNKKCMSANYNFLNNINNTNTDQIMTTTDSLNDFPNNDNIDKFNSRKLNKVNFEHPNSNKLVKHKKTKKVDFSNLVEIYEVDSYKEMNQLMNLDDYDYMTAFKEQKAMNLVKCCCNIF